MTNIIYNLNHLQTISRDRINYKEPYLIILNQKREINFQSRRQILIHVLEKFTENKISFQYGKYGKPYLLSKSYPFFSLSHHGQYFIVAIYYSDIGVDVIDLSRIRNQIIPYFTLCEDEILYIKESNLDNNEKKLLYCKMWALKESISKYFGNGMQMDFTKINTRKIIQKDSDVHICNNMFIENHSTSKYLLYLCRGAGVSNVFTN